MLAVLIAFLIINVLLYFRQQLYTAILAGLLIIVLFNPITPGAAFSLFIESLTSPMAILLGLIVLLFTAFGNLLKEMGTLTAMVEKLSLVLRDLRVQLAVLPALMGMLMFPGGAVFSAPLVEEAGLKAELDNNRLVVINILFRHVLYIIFPLYATLILLGEISQISVTRFITANVPIFIVFLIILSVTIFRGVGQSQSPKRDLRALPALFYHLSPLVIVLLLAIAFDLYLPLAVLVGIIIALSMGKPSTATLKSRLSALVKGINWRMAASIVSVIIFKDFLEQTQAINGFVESLTAQGIPLLALALIIPYLVGFITGNHTAAIGISAPLFLSVQPELILYYLSTAFIAGLAGYLGSPIHLCTVFTAEHFKVPLTDAVKHINYYTLPLAVFTTIFYAFLI
ncbi:DUF401 family protein [Dethiobacter alkaliphilus]|uniref:DUF401 family protein n=1 Tax=Dethiobacter alkaliphilus AHT 1 TaxID=555088 RepID=C0GI32_DETAL|nr:DUF401 family protein [Dethiobacter alkaliphilus]EEG77106.1 protein of unknown function DUF401 [Dethiobacter alkaliphilus AHT 1]